VPTLERLLLGIGIAVAVYLVLVGALLLAGRRTDALALARFIPDCLVMRRLIADPSVPLRIRRVVRVKPLVGARLVGLRVERIARLGVAVVAEAEAGAAGLAVHVQAEERVEHGRSADLMASASP
jgi:hypothetical protein